MKRTNYFNIAIITFIVIALGAIGHWGYTSKYGPGTKTYSNETYGVTFTYPNNYDLQENSLSSAQGATVVVLTDKKAVSPSNGEGPVSMTIGMYPLAAFSPASGADPLLSWVTSSPYSNFSQSAQKEPGLTTIANQNAYLYTWDGLYNGTTVTTLHDGSIITFSVTYDGNSDMQIRQDFTDLVASTQFTGSTTTSAVH
jgi:hypothetical protein